MAIFNPKVTGMNLVSHDIEAKQFPTKSVVKSRIVFEKPSEMSPIKEKKSGKVSEEPRSTFRTTIPEGAVVTFSSVIQNNDHYPAKLFREEIVHERVQDLWKQKFEDNFKKAKLEGIMGCNSMKHGCQNELWHHFKAEIYHFKAELWFRSDGCKYLTPTNRTCQCAHRYDTYGTYGSCSCSYRKHIGTWDHRAYGEYLENDILVYLFVPEHMVTRIAIKIPGLVMETKDFFCPYHSYNWTLVIYRKKEKKNEESTDVLGEYSKDLGVIPAGSKVMCSLTYEVENDKNHGKMIKSLRVRIPAEVDPKEISAISTKLRNIEDVGKSRSISSVTCSEKEITIDAKIGKSVKAGKKSKQKKRRKFENELDTDLEDYYNYY